MSIGAFRGIGGDKMSASIDIPATPSSSKYGSSCSGSPALESPTPNHGATSKRRFLHEKRPSLLSLALAKQECTVINVGAPNGPTQLISYLSSSQGFMWNPEIFVPSHVECDYVPLDSRRELVHEIFLTEEEIQQLLPH